MSARLFFRWVGACAIGEAIGLTFSGVVAAIVGVIFAPDVGDPDPWVLRGLMVFAGFIEGACVGGAQVALLRGRFPDLSAASFTVLTGLGMAVGWGLGSAFASGGEEFVSPNQGTMIIFALASGVGLGAVLGTVQAALLRRHLRGAHRWIVANVIGWALAMVLSFFGTNAMPGGTYGPGALGVLLVTGAAMGAVVGIATALLSLNTAMPSRA